MNNTITANRRVSAIAFGVAVAIAAGLVAAWVRDEPAALVALVFSASLLGPATALGWFLLVPATATPPEHVADTVEQRWLEKAATGALTDLLLAAGIALTLTSVLDLEFSGNIALLLVLVLVMGDAMLRYVVLARRES